MLFVCVRVAVCLVVRVFFKMNLRGFDIRATFVLILSFFSFSFVLNCFLADFQLCMRTYLLRCTAPHRKMCLVVVAAVLLHQVITCQIIRFGYLYLERMSISSLLGLHAVLYLYDIN